MKRIALAALVSLATTAALAQSFPTTMPPQTVYGRLGTVPGPGQAIPLTTLEQVLGLGGGGGTVIANTVIGNFTGSTGVAIANPMPACPDTSGQHLNYVPNVGFGCGTTAIGGAASSVSYTPYGTISSTNVQAALNELSDEKAATASLAPIATSGSIADLGGVATQIWSNNLTGDKTAGAGLTLQSTSGASGSADYVRVLVGSNEAARWYNDGGIPRFLINGTVPFNNFFSSVNPLLQLNVTQAGGATAVTASFARWTDDNGGVRNIYGKSKGHGVVGGQGALANNDNVMSIESHGSDGNIFGLMNRIQGSADGDASYSAGPPVVHSTPGKLLFLTTPTGANNSTTRMTVWNDGGVSIGPSAAVITPNSPGPNGVLQVDDHIFTPKVVGSSTANSALTLQGSSGGGVNQYVNVMATDALGNTFEAFRVAPDTFGNALTPRVLIGTTAAQRFNGTTTGQLQIHSAVNSQDTYGMTISNWASGGSGGTIVGTKSTGGSVGAHGPVADGNNILNLLAQSSDGTNWGYSGRISIASDGGSSAGFTPGKIIFQTQNTGVNNSLVTRQTIWKDGGISMNADTASPGPGVTRFSNGITTQYAFPFIFVTATGLSFNGPTSDIAVTIPPMPTGFSRLRVIDSHVSHASGAIAAAFFGVFTTTGGGGVAIVPNTQLNSITSTAENTAGNVQRIAGNLTTSIQPSSLPTPNTLYFRNTTPQGTAVTADLTITFSVLP